MKKGAVILTLLVISILFISVNFVSAGFIGDILGRITGRTTENVTVGAETLPIDEEPEPEPPVDGGSCGDTICEVDEMCDIDCCEAFCTLECPHGAVQGSCGCECIEPVPPEPGQEICCKITFLSLTTETITYRRILAEECVSSPEADESYEIVADGYCAEEDPVEKQCDEGEIKYYECSDGTKVPECKCQDGMWVCKVSVKDDCPESAEPETCATRIQITFNKDVYKIGDDVKMIIETFDSQGNHLPNYAFYGQMYDDRWHTADLQKTNDEGYFIHTGTAERPAGGVTEVKFKVYTKETSSCGSVEDTIEIKLELGKCGMGECAPEPECENKIRRCGGECAPCPEEDRDGEIFYLCNGCELEDKCYPYGYRKAGDYCLDETDMFVSQSEDDSSCENSFECETNLCINGNCVSKNLWNRFLEWFKKLFGDDDEEPTDCSKLLIERNIGDNEYIESAYGVDEHTHVPVHSEDGENIGTIKCCAAGYSTGMVMVCEFDKKEDVRNSLRWILAKGIDEGPFELGEYKGEKVLNIGDNGILVWTKNAYLIASGGTPEAHNKFVEELVDAYFKRYKSDFDIIEDDIPYVEPEPDPVPCEEITDNEEQAGCYIELAMATSDAPLCENIVYNSDHRDKCYIHVAEHTGDDSICEMVSGSDLREKCYFWVAEETGEGDICAGISDADLKAICYVNIAEQTWDASICENVVEIRIRNKCYREVAISLNDASICELIIDDGLGGLNPKDECYAGTD